MARSEGPKRRTINCDFFRVHMPEGFDDFGKCLTDALLKKPNVQERNYASEDGIWRIQQVHQRTPGSISGVFVNLRTTADARIAREDAEGLDELVLEDGRSLAEYCCFVYQSDFQTLIVHRNRYAGGHARIEFYASKMLDCPGITFGLIINQDALARLARMEYRQKVEIAISNPANLSHVDQNVSARNFANLASEGDVELLNVTLSAGRKRNGIGQKLVDSIASLVRRDEAQVKTAKVRGRLDGEMVTIDLIKDRMQEAVDVQLAGQRISLDEVTLALEQAYERRRGEIGRQFTEPPE